MFVASIMCRAGICQPRGSIPKSSTDFRPDSLYKRLAVIQEERLHVPKAEVARIMKNPLIEKRIIEIEKLGGIYLSDLAKQALVRGLEIIEATKEDHYTLVHGQRNGIFLTLNSLKREVSDRPFPLSFETLLPTRDELESLPKSLSLINSPSLLNSATNLIHSWGSSTNLIPTSLHPTSLNLNSPLRISLENGVSYAENKYKSESLASLIKYLKDNKRADSSFERKFKKIDAEIIARNPGVLYFTVIPKALFSKCVFSKDLNFQVESDLNALQKETHPLIQTPTFYLIANELEENNIKTLAFPMDYDLVYDEMVLKIKELMLNTPIGFRYLE